MQPAYTVKRHNATVKWCRKCAESVTRCRTDKFPVCFWIQPVKCLELAAQQVDCSRYEVLGRQRFGRHILSSFWERPAVSSVQNTGDDGQCTLTSTHSTTAGIVKPHHVDICIPELMSWKWSAEGTWVSGSFGHNDLYSLFMCLVVFAQKVHIAMQCTDT